MLVLALVIIVLLGGGWLLWQVLEVALWLVAVLFILGVAAVAWAYGALRRGTA
jgi:hypothetical protein